MLAALLFSIMVQQPFTSEAPSIVAALTYETVEIREDFAGTELVLYGATRGLTLQDEIVVVLRGPAQDVRVMRKQRNFGIWMNTAPAVFVDTPSYYSIASSRPISDIADPDALMRNQIGLDNLLASENSMSDQMLTEYRNAIARTAGREERFAQAPNGVEVLDGGLFRATINLPPLTPVGDYTAEVYLFRDGRPIASRSSSLTVEKAGIERLLYEFANNAPIFYGLFCVILAMLSGYIAAVLFGRR